MPPVPDRNYRLINEDMRVHCSLLQGLPIHAIITDPPYNLGFMGKKWDSTGIAFQPETWKVLIDIVPPGTHLVAFGGTRTHHRIMCAIEDAGWELRDTLCWLYGSGFPKGLDIGKAIDGHITQGRSDSLSLREVNETRPGEAKLRPSSTNGHRGIVGNADAGPSVKRHTPATQQGAQWDGWNVAIKPAWEPIILARKPLEGTVAQNVLKYGVGGLNINGCRVEFSSDKDKESTKAANSLPKRSSPTGNDGKHFTDDAYIWPGSEFAPSQQGRWPANIVHDGSDEVMEAFAAFGDKKGSPASWKGNGGTDRKSMNCADDGSLNKAMEFAGYADDGTAARFFYCAKASKRDRGSGNTHPTVKPIALMQWLVRLLCPIGGTVLDPFMGSGSTGKACAYEGMKFIGLENDKEHGYFAMAQKRVSEAYNAASKND